MKVAILWWNPVSIGGATQAIRGHVIGFIRAGHDVDLWFRSDIEAFEDVADDYDLVLTPFLDVAMEAEAHVHMQIGGFGNPQIQEESIRRSLDAADTVSAMDSSLVDYFQEKAGLKPSSCTIIPNPPNTELFEKQPPEEHEGFAFAPKIGSTYKTGELLIPIAGRSTDVVYEAHSQGEIPSGLPVNVVIKPGVPFSAMFRRYRDAGVIVNPAEQESGPGVAYEAFMTGRPFVAPQSGMGNMKTIDRKILDTSDFGASASWWLDEYGAYIGSGVDEHYVARPVDQVGSIVRGLLTKDEEWHRIVEGGHDWIATWGGWGWKEKAETLVEASIGNG